MVAAMRHGHGGGMVRERAGGRGRCVAVGRALAEPAPKMVFVLAKMRFVWVGALRDGLCSEGLSGLREELVGLDGAVRTSCWGDCSMDRWRVLSSDW